MNRRGFFSTVAAILVARKIPERTKTLKLNYDSLAGHYASPLKFNRTSIDDCFATSGRKIGGTYQIKRPAQFMLPGKKLDMEKLRRECGFLEKV